MSMEIPGVRTKKNAVVSIKRMNASLTTWDLLALTKGSPASLNPKQKKTQKSSLSQMNIEMVMVRVKVVVQVC